jgi:hypothetical protein
MRLSCHVLSKNNTIPKKRKATSEMLPATKATKKKTTPAEQHGPLHDRAGALSGSIPEGDAESNWGSSAAGFNAWDEGGTGAAGVSTQFDEDFASDVALSTTRDDVHLTFQNVLQCRWGKMNYIPDDNMGSITGDRDEDDLDYDNVMDDNELPDQYSEEEDDVFDSALPGRDAWEEEFIRKSIGMFSPLYQRLIG